MTYLAFLLLFLVVPIGLLVRWASVAPRVPPDMPFGRSMALIAVIAFLYTTPWDNYLVHSSVWSYGTDRVLGTIGYVPVEEYAFFLLQPVMTAWWTRLMLNRWAPSSIAPRGWPRLVAGVAAAGAAAGAVLLVIGPDEATYLGLILAWALPVIAALALFSRRTLSRFGRAVAWGIGVPTVYLWIVDRWAIADGIWTIEAPTSTGFNPLGLPIEEALFFAATNVLVVFGLLTFMYGRGSSGNG